MRLRLVAALSCALLSIGCTGTKAAYQAASSPDEYAYVLTEHYASLVHEAADLKENPTTRPEAIEALQKADDAIAPIILGNAKATPPTPGLRELAAAYKQVHDAASEAELQAAIDNAVLKLADLVRAVKAARASPRAELWEHQLLERADKLRLRTMLTLSEVPR